MQGQIVRTFMEMEMAWWLSSKDQCLENEKDKY